MKPYKIIGEDSDSITYQYKSIFTWALYGIILLLFAGMFAENNLVQYIGAGLVGLYFLIKIIGGKQITADIRNALQNQSVEISGSKHSFSKPLTIRIPKNA